MGVSTSLDTNGDVERIADVLLPFMPGQVEAPTA
jgi:hypothetical protein